MTTPDQALQQIFDFTLDDLHANQEGMVSGRQRASFQRATYPYYLSIASIALIVGFWAVVLFFQITIRGTLLWVLVSTSVMWIVWLAVRDTNNVDPTSSLRVDLKNPQVNVVVGQPQLLPPKSYQRTSFYQMGVAGWQLFVTEHQYKQFGDFLKGCPDQEFVVFFLPQSKRVLSMQMVSLDAEDFFERIEAEV